NRAGLSSKMSPVYCPVTAEKTLPPSFEGWQNAGIYRPTGFLTLNISESPNVAVECSLSQVLEPEAQLKYSLSQKAAAGILNRASRRGKELPPRLQTALQSIAYVNLETTRPTLKVLRLKPIQPKTTPILWHINSEVSVNTKPIKNHQRLHPTYTKIQQTSLLPELCLPLVQERPELAILTLKQTCWWCKPLMSAI